MIEIKAYHCEYCKKYSKNKGVITRHEKECYKRPEMKACATCKHFYQEQHSRPFFGDQVAYHFRPVCEKGIELYREDESELGYKATLRSKCDDWEKAEEES